MAKIFKKIFKSVTGEITSVELTPELYEVIRKLDREEWKSDKKYQRHTISFDAMVYEGKNLSHCDQYPSLQEDDKAALRKKLRCAKSSLTTTEARRMKRYRQVCRLETVATEDGVTKQAVNQSVLSAENKLIKIFKPALKKGPKMSV